MVPKSCGPWLIVHVRVTALPAFTYMSEGPNILALASVTIKRYTLYFQMRCLIKCVYKYAVVGSKLKRLSEFKIILKAWVDLLASIMEDCWLAKFVGIFQGGVIYTKTYIYLCKSGAIKESNGLFTWDVGLCPNSTVLIHFWEICYVRFPNLPNFDVTLFYTVFLFSFVT